MFSLSWKVVFRLVLLCTFVLVINGGKVKRQLEEVYVLEEYPSHDVALAAAPIGVEVRAVGSGGVKLPGFVTLAHKVSSGTVTIKDSRTILIQNFSYDGSGPDAYFLVGKGQPNAAGRKIPNEHGSYDVLEGYENQDIELLLPADLTWNDVDYLSVFCISFNHNFGYVKIPKGIKVPEYQG